MDFFWAVVVLLILYRLRRLQVGPIQIDFGSPDPPIKKPRLTDGVIQKLLNEWSKR